ncbi:MAG: PAS domain S-box protein [Ktedonobacteraceae bacterium]
MSREALMQSELLFRALIEHSTDAIILITPEGTITYASPSTACVTGYTPEELVGVNGFDLIHPDEQGKVIHHLTSLTRHAGESLPLEYCLRHKDGTWRWMEGTATNLLDDPAVGAIVCTYRDITERKQSLACEQKAYTEAEKEVLCLAEREAKARANQLTAIFEAMTDGVAVCDHEGHVKQTNAAFRALFAMGADAEPVQLLPNEWGMWAVPYDLRGRPLFQVLRGEHLSSLQMMDLIGHSRAGQELFLNVRGAPIRDDAGQIVGGIAVYRDVTERHRLEEQLQYAERKLVSLVDSNIVGVMVTDREGRMYEVNDRLVQLLGYSREELLSETMRVGKLLVPSYGEARSRAWKTLISQGASLPEEKEYICKDGGRFPALVVAATINQERSRALVVLLDISDRKAAELRKQEFLGMVNHELRTPLTIIQGMIEIALLHVESLPTTSSIGTDDLHKIETLLQQALRQAEIETRLVAELLDVSRIEMQQFELSLQRCNLISIVQQVVASQQQVASTHRIELVLPSQSVVPVMADADRIEQALTNYLTNAFKYSPADGVVSVHLNVEREMARVSVHDQGPGLTLEQQQRVWDRFYQTGTARRSGVDVGLGLGLYIVRTIVAQHQGQVGVESRPGQGATFWFLLPLTDEPNQA